MRRPASPVALLSLITVAALAVALAVWSITLHPESPTAVEAPATQDARPPAVLTSPAYASIQAPVEVMRRERAPRPGESLDAANRRNGVLTECDLTRGKKIKAYGREYQLPADTCVYSRGANTRVLLDQGGNRAVLFEDGRIVRWDPTPVQRTPEERAKLEQLVAEAERVDQAARPGGMLGIGP